MKLQAVIEPLLSNTRARLRPIAYTIASWLIPNSIRRLEQLQDWAQLSFYQTHNQEISSPVSNENRVVFFGDSITEFWDLATAFPGKPYLNRGIAGQTTSQMLLRLRADVISLQPKIVLILAGTNDLAGNTGPMSLEMITDNYASIAELASFHAIQIIFASVLPIHNYSGIPQFKFRSPAQILALNDWLKNYCQRFHHHYLDYYNHLVDDRGMLKAEFSEDGVHPNANGYAVMAPLAEAIIQQVLKTKQKNQQKNV